MGCFQTNSHNDLGYFYSFEKKNQRSLDGDEAGHGVNEVLCWGTAIQEKKTEAGMVQYMHG